MRKAAQVCRGKKIIIRKGGKLRIQRLMIPPLKICTSSVLPMRTKNKNFSLHKISRPLLLFIKRTKLFAQRFACRLQRLGRRARNVRESLQCVLAVMKHPQQAVFDFEHGTYTSLGKVK